MRSSTRLVLAAGLAAAVCVAQGRAAQQPAQPQAQQGSQQSGQQQSGQQQDTQAPADQGQKPVFRTGINFVRVDVIVSDKAGSNIGDLKQTDFEVTEDGKPQAIETFKLVKLDGGTTESIKEPPKQIRTDYDEETEAARDDVRLFGIFLDDYHVRRGTSMSVREQLARFVQTQIGPSDMLGIMYPLESVSQVRFTRNHDAVSRGLEKFLGRKFEYEPKNEFEERYAYYPAEVVERVRNEVSLSALKGLIIHMGTLKEGRKALILVSEGYTYYLPPQLRNPIATMPGVGNPAAFDPFAGLNDPNEDRANWSATMDMETDLRNVYAEANRQNVSIYTVDPRGLATNAFDIDENVNMQTDRDYLSRTMDTLRELAENTDGKAIVNRNDVVAGMKQIVHDESAYYLIGYNSSQAPSDGKFHEIKVRVKRPNVQVRARKGYWALTPEETARATAKPKPAPPKAVDSALAAINVPARSRVIRSWIGTSRGENGKTRLTFVWEPVQKAPGERATAPGEQPARVSLMAVGEDGSPYFRGRVPDIALASTSPGSAAAANGSASATPHGPSRVSFDVNPGKVQLRVSVEGGSSQVLDSETREITVPDLTAPQATLGTPEVFRARTAREFQQLKTDVQAVPTASREFSRAERLLIRVPAYAGGTTTPTVSAHLLNRAGDPMSDIAVAAPVPPSSEATIDLPLAGLAPGEYVLEIKASDNVKELVGFRVTG